MKHFKILFICVAFIFSVYGISCGEDVKIFPVGGLFAMTGPQGYYGRVMSRGAQLAIDHLNSTSGIKGYQFKLHITDFQNVDVNLAITGVQKMILTKKIPFLLTSFSPISLAVQPVCENSHVLMINGGGYSPNLINKPYLYTIRLSQTQMVPPMLKFFRDMNIQKLGLIYMTDPGEVIVKELVRPLWTQMGGVITGDESHKPGLTDYRESLGRIKAGNPDAIYNFSHGQDQGYVVRQAREMGMDIPISVPDWNDRCDDIAGKTVENVYMPGDYFDLENSDPVTRHFVTDYQEKWKETPDFYAANYYDAVYNILAELVKRVVKNGGNPLDGAELEKAIWTDPSFTTVYGGKITLNRDGSSHKSLAIFRFAEGKKNVEKMVNIEE